MTANQIINSLTFAEVDATLAPDTRRMMRDERFTLSAAVESGDGRQITDAMLEAQRVAKMWGVDL